MSWKIRGRLAGLLLLILSFVAANTGHSIGPAQAGSGDKATGHKTFKTRMIAAQSAAQEHFDQFVAFILDNDGVAQIDAGVKVSVQDRDGAHAVAWLSLVAKHEGAFFGLLNDTSNAMKNHRVGDMIEFSEAQVRDWYFLGPDGKTYGAYTTREAFSDLPAETAARIGLQLSESPLPTNW